MTWDWFVRLIAEESRLELKVTKRVLKRVFIRIESSARVYGRFAVPDFGVFRRSTRKAKRVLSPDGEWRRSPPHSTLAFTASERVKARFYRSRR
jgi:nucleoid DNA-binding protein